MKEIKIENKEKYLKENYPLSPIPKMEEKRHCIHCGEDINVRDYKVFKENGFEFICCPNAPECDGTLIDWLPVGLM